MYFTIAHYDTLNLCLTQKGALVGILSDFRALYKKTTIVLRNTLYSTSCNILAKPDCADNGKEQTACNNLHNSAPENLE